MEVGKESGKETRMGMGMEVGEGDREEVGEEGEDGGGDGGGRNGGGDGSGGWGLGGGDLKGAFTGTRHFLATNCGTPMTSTPNLSEASFRRSADDNSSSVALCASSIVSLSCSGSGTLRKSRVARRSCSAYKSMSLFRS